MLSKILIANRGEIACRIIKTCKKLGIKSVAVYSDPDCESLHVRMADERIALIGSEAKDTYLNIEKIIKACKESNAEAVHPGYGFLSENAEFAKALKKNKIKFIGPKPETIELMGDKVRAKEFAKKCKVPLVPGIDSEEQVENFIKESGFPILLKAAAGGGGRGMRKIYHSSELKDGIAGAKREAESFFKDGRLFVEKLIENGRHIEVQIFGDEHGEAMHLLDRDCTTQRKHQKVIEEAPALFIDPKSRKEILDSAVKLCKDSGYIGAGTVEFILAPEGKYYFLEVNSRLQVEHPVTEEILGLDLVELQIRIASGEKISNILGGLKIESSGFAIECRVCAESPEDGFITSTGKILNFNSDLLNTLPGVRVDTGFGTGDIITHYYDSLIAKVIVKGSSREVVIERARTALKNFHICGVKTNIPYLLTLLESREFQSGCFHINLAETLIPSIEDQKRKRALAAALFSLANRYNENAESHDAWSGNYSWRQRESFQKSRYLVAGTVTEFSLYNCGRDTFHLKSGSTDDIAETWYHISQLNITANFGLSFHLDGRSHSCTIYFLEGRKFISTHFGTFEIAESYPSLKTTQGHVHSNVLLAPFPGKIVSIKGKVGQKVDAGSAIIVLESMKMEHLIKSPLPATIEEIPVKAGEVIEANRILVKLAFE